MKNTIYFFLAKDYRMMSSRRQRAWCFRRYGRQLVSKQNSRDFVEKNDVGGATVERITKHGCDDGEAHYPSILLLR